MSCHTHAAVGDLLPPLCHRLSGKSVWLKPQLDPKYFNRL